MRLPRRPFLTTRAHDAFAQAYDLAALHGHPDVGAVHVALGVLREGRGVAVAILHERGVPLQALARELEAALPPSGAAGVAVSTHAWSAGGERWVEAARAEAEVVGTEYYGCEHLLLAVLRDPLSDPARVLARHGVRRTDVEAALQRLRGHGPAAP